MPRDFKKNATNEYAKTPTSTQTSVFIRGGEGSDAERRSDCGRPAVLTLPTETAARGV
jgi:hypothetical protein